MRNRLSVYQLKTSEGPVPEDLPSGAAPSAGRKPFPMVVTDVNPEVPMDESEVHPRRKPYPMVVTDVNPEVSKDESDVHPPRKLYPMVVTDVNPEVSKDESEVHP